MGIKADGVGIDLISQEAAPQVPSAQVGLTAGFEKEPGVPPPQETPTTVRGENESVVL